MRRWVGRLSASVAERKPERPAAAQKALGGARQSGTTSTNEPTLQAAHTHTGHSAVALERTTLATVLQRTAPHVGTETACWVSHLVGRAVLHSAMTVAIHGMHYTLHAAGCVLS